MRIEFKSSQLRDCFLNQRLAQKFLGKDLAARFRQRVDLLYTLQKWEDAVGVPGWRCHPLKGNRRGQWAIKLGRFHRLIVTVSNGALEIVTIEEISKHYGD